MKRSFVYGFLVMAATVAATTPARAVSYSGSLSVGDTGLSAVGVWDNVATTFRWVVDDTTTPGRWHYSYTLATPGGPGAGISHVIFEASDGFGFENLFAPATDPSDWISQAADGTEIQTHLPGPGNPDMPSSVYGIKFNAADNADATTLALSFDSDRVPVWGDFYAKAGQGALWNSGFSAADPTDGPADGSIEHHVLVPDTATILIPVPGALVLGSLGVVLVGWIRGYRRLI